MSLTKTVIHSALWNFADQFLRHGISAVSAIVLSYYLLPADFGLLSMLALFLSLGSGLMDFGLREALVRRRKLSIRLLNTAAWGALLLGGTAYAVLFLCAPYIAKFYGQPALTELLRIASLTIILNALQTAPAARLMHSFDFKVLAATSFPASLISNVSAIVLAHFGAGVWALIAQMLIASLISSFLLWRVAGWQLYFGLDVKTALSLCRFGYRLFLSGLISIFVKNAAPIFVGKYLGATLAGYWYFIDRIMDVVMGQLVYVIQNVSYPAFSKLNASGVGLKDACRNVVSLTVFVVSPFLAIGAGVADPLFAFLFDEPWQPAAQYFRWMCITYMMYPLHAINLSILKVKGRTDIFLRLEVIKAVLLVGLVLATVRYGLSAVVAGQMFGSVLCYLLNSSYSHEMIQYSMRQQLRDALPAWVLSLLCGIVAYIISKSLNESPAVLQLLLGTAAATTIFVVCALIFRFRGGGLLLDVTKTLMR